MNVYRYKQHPDHAVGVVCVPEGKLLIQDDK